MHRSLVPISAIVAASVLAACGGGQAGSPSAGSTAAAAPTVTAKQLGGAGTVLVDASGRPLYDNDQEARGTVLCKGACTSFWTPLTVSGTPTATRLAGPVGVVQRPDGSRQVTYNGKLLYAFSLDSPGKVTGDGFADAFGGQKFTWHVARSSAATSSSGGSSGSTSPARGY